MNIIFFRCLVILYVFISHECFSQAMLYGKVYDTETKQPIPFASIRIANSLKGTNSNADGEFELVAHLPVKIIVSALNYENDTIAVTNKTAVISKIYLQPALILLPEIRVGSYVGEIISRAYRYLKNNVSYINYGQALYRQTTKLDDQIVEIQELIWNTKSNNLGLIGTSLSRGRYGEYGATIKYRDFSRYTKTVGISQPSNDSTSSSSIISLNASNYYFLSIIGIIQNKNQQLVEIAFVNKKEINARNIKGSVIIDTNTNQILRLRVESSTIHSKATSPLYKLSSELIASELVFQPIEDGNVRLNYVGITYSASINRPLKKPVQIQVVSSTYLYESNSRSTKLTYSSAVDNKSAIESVKDKAYDSSFWKNNPIVKRTPVEEKAINFFESQSILKN